MKLALAIIVKDELELVEKIVSDYGKYFDEIVLAVDERVDEFKAKLGDKCKIHPYTWINDFSHKRNFLAEKVESEYYLRIDTDDKIADSENIRLVFENFASNGYDVLYVPYLYGFDENGACIAKHWRETIIRKRSDVYWKKAIHENVFMDDVNSVKLLKDKRISIVHQATHEHAIQSFKRNFQYLLQEYKRDGNNTDPRTLAYLGRMLQGEGQFRAAIEFLQILVEKSGWSDDKYFAWIQISQCWQALQNHQFAVAACNEALAINTTFPDAYIQMGTLYFDKQDFVKAVDWLMSGIVRPEPDTVMVVDPSFYGFRAKMTAALALLGKGDVELAWKYYQEVKKLAPNNKLVQEQEDMFREAYEGNIYIKNLLWLINFTKDRDNSKVSKLIESIPSKCFKDERLWSLKNRFSLPKTWGNKEIAIYCGQAWEDWAAPSVIKGIGGSEEAVIYISQELTKLGYSVKVYCSCGDLEGTYDGVEYLPYYSFNPKDNFNILISWRNNNLAGIKAKKRIVWLHDVPMPDMFPKSSIDSFDKVIVLSQYHKSLLPEYIPEEKILVSSNGINLKDFSLNGVVRNPKRIIYTSSYDRGIEHLLKMWPEILKEVPEAELHLFYGWNTYDEMVARGARDGKFKSMLMPYLKQPGVYEHGRIGHKALVKEFQKSGIWAYPSHFEEISCISGMKAQAAGCVPVVTDYAALTETVKAGVKISGKGGEVETDGVFKDEIVKILKDAERQEEVRLEVLRHKEEFGWDKVAEQWDKELLNVS